MNKNTSLFYLAMDRERILLLVAVTALVAAGILARGELNNALMKTKDLLLSGMGAYFARESLQLEPIEINLGNETDLFAVNAVSSIRNSAAILGDTVSTGTLQASEAGFASTQAVGPIDEIETEVELISLKTKILTIKVEQYIKEGQLEQVRLTEIQNQIQLISGQIEVLSQRVLEFNQSATVMPLNIIG